MVNKSFIVKSPNKVNSNLSVSAKLASFDLRHAFSLSFVVD
jgi:hypothetical protein